MRRAARRILGTALAAVLASGCGRHESAGRQRSEGLLPDALAGMPLAESRSGSQAAALIGHMHRQSVAPDETYVGRYGIGSNHATLYVSRFTTGPQADSVLAEMSAGIGAGSGGFAHHETFAVGSTAVHMVLGYGQMHFFLVRGARLIWLAMSPGMARAGLAQLLDVAVDAVPPLDSLLPAAEAGHGAR